MSFTTFGQFSFGRSKTGLTSGLRVQPRTIAGASTGSPIGPTGFSEVGLGMYEFTGDVPDDAVSLKAYHTSDTAVMDIQPAKLATAAGKVMADAGGIFDDDTGYQIVLVGAYTGEADGIVSGIPANVWAYATRTITGGGFTSDDRTTLSSLALVAPDHKLTVNAQGQVEASNAGAVDVDAIAAAVVEELSASGIEPTVVITSPTVEDGTIDNVYAGDDCSIAMAITNNGASVDGLPLSLRVMKVSDYNALGNEATATLVATANATQADATANVTFAIAAAASAPLNNMAGKNGVTTYAAQVTVDESGAKRVLWQGEMIVRRRIGDAA